MNEMLEKFVLTLCLTFYLTLAIGGTALLIFGLIYLMANLISGPISAFIFVFLAVWILLFAVSLVE